jgi:phage-related protein
MPEIKDKIMGFFSNSVKALEPALNKAKEIVGEVWNWGKEHLLPTLKEAFLTVLDMVKVLLVFIRDEVWPVLKRIFSNFKIIIEGLLKWLKDDIFPLIKQAWEWAVKELGGFILWLADNIVARLVKVIPMIQNIITQVIDILLNSLLKPLWKALEPILKWYLDLVMDNWTWIIKTINEKILPFIKGILDDLMPHVQSVSDYFMAHVAPKITEFWEAFREFADALLDVLLPIIKLALKHVIFPVGAFLLKALGFIVGKIFLVMKWILQGLTWLLKLPFTWREELLNPILSALDFGFDWIKKIFFYAKNLNRIILMAGLDVMSVLIRKMAYGKISIMGKDVNFGFLHSAANALVSGFNNLQRSYVADKRSMEAGLSTSTGGMRAKYGTSPVEVTINNFSETKVLDDTRKLQIMQGEKREVDNIQRREDSLGTYDDVIRL